MGPKNENFAKFRNIMTVMESKRLAPAHSLHDLKKKIHKFAQVFGDLHIESCIKIWGDLLKGFQSYGGLNLRESSYRQIFRAL